MARARYLKGRAEFRQAIEHERAAWDAQFPGFAIGKPHFPPDEVLDKSNVVPFTLPMALLTRKKVFDADPVLSILNERDAETSPVEMEWLRTTSRVARAWWPKRYFPHSNAVRHPAQPFISACHVWRLEGVSEEWTDLDQVLRVSTRPAETIDDELASRTYWMVYGSELTQALADAAESGRDVSPDENRKMRWDAGQTAAWESLAVLRSDPLTWIPFVRLVPGITTSDWRNLEANVMATLQTMYGSNPVHVHVRELHAEGLSVRRIAGTLGISERQVSRILKAQTPTD